MIVFYSGLIFDILYLFILEFKPRLNCPPDLTDRNANHYTKRRVKIEDLNTFTGCNN